MFSFSEPVFGVNEIITEDIIVRGSKEIQRILIINVCNNSFACLHLYMKASTERKIIRWLHILVSIPIIGYIYGPVAQIPQAAAAVRFVIFPFVLLSGFWLWKGHVVKRWFKRK